MIAARIHRVLLTMAKRASTVGVGVSNHYILETLSKYPLVRFRGVFSCDTIPLEIANQQQFTLICNLDRQTGPGSHYVVIVGLPGRLYYVDPIGLDSFNDDINKFLASASKACGDRRIYVLKTPLPQDPSSEFCGLHAMLLVLFFDRDGHGIVLKGGSHTCLKQNDALCILYIVKFLRLYKRQKNYRREKRPRN